ncbi:hypothetical protein [Streptomyces mobaraensis]|uniref:N-acetyltransferase domain-containing protein n=1 Tax=Streptomyces mobaraensis TaxID=35621 RepID=A0A5N5W158_STRMB|nr:hypothetical protein [Streptomyces mobaraensis]KAB7835524.1 hypothetical protein FRZ00_26915 [Streptomyces mobaraensis]
MSFPASPSPPHAERASDAPSGVVAASAAGAVPPPYQVRPAEQGDRAQVEDVMFRRLIHLPGDVYFRDRLQSARDLVIGALGCEDEGRPVVWLLADGPEIIGCTALLTGTLVPGWPEEQQTDSALTVSALFTDPTYRCDRPGRFLIWWALDYAARLGGIQWLRAATRSERIMRFTRDEIGCRDIRTVVHHGRHLQLLQQPPRLMPSLPVFIAGPSAAHPRPHSDARAEGQGA